MFRSYRLRAVRVCAILLCLAVGTIRLGAATGTLMPTPFHTVFTASGVPIPGAKVYSYIAGTTTAIATYTDVSLVTPNTNPIVADSAGRFGPIYLTPGTSYKFAYQDAAGVAIKTIDNVAAVPGASAGVDITGTAGEAITAGQAAYLSDGSAGKTAGLWYKADATTTYSSITPVVGIASATIPISTSGSIRIVGPVTGLSGLTTGAVYYVSGTPGSLTSTAPGNVRLLGQADSTTTFVLKDIPRVSTGTYTAKTAIYTAVANDIVAATSGTFTVTIPAASANVNKTIWVVNNGTGTITLARTGADTIGLATSWTLNPATASSQGDSVVLISDGISNWNIF